MNICLAIDIFKRFPSASSLITVSERSSRRSGYLPEQNENGQVMLIIPYRGRFGAGWIVATHYTNTTVNCKYCLLADGGLNHGTD